MPLVASAASQAASQVGGTLLGGAQLVKGAIDEKKAKRELARLHQPLYGIQPEYYQNKNISEQLAGQGLPSATKDFLATETQRGLGAGIGAITQTGGGGINDISKLMDVYNRSLSKIGAEDAETHLKNIQYFMGANKDLAGQKNMQWTINEYQPYQAKLKELTKRREAAEQNIWGGLQTMVGSASAAGTSMSNQGLMSKLFGDKTDPFQSGGEALSGLMPSGTPSTVDPNPGVSGAINTDLATIGRPLMYR